MSTEQTENPTENTQDATQDSPEPPGRAETLETTPKPGEERTEPEDDMSKLRREAAAHRVAAKEAREALEATNGRLKTAQDAILAAELRERRVQITPAALEAVGLRDGVFDPETGEIDSLALFAALARAKDTFGLSLHRRPAPDMTTGREVPPGGPEGGVPASSWSQVIGKK